MNIIVIKSTENEVIALNFSHISRMHLYVDANAHLLKCDGNIYTIDYETWHEVARMMRFQWSRLQ
jgi:hypothetical protein